MGIAYSRYVIKEGGFPIARSFNDLADAANDAHHAKQNNIQNILTKQTETRLELPYLGDGRTISLSSNTWGDAANETYFKKQNQEALDRKAKAQRELFYIENEQLTKIDEPSDIDSDKHQGDILILIPQENGHYSSMRADPSNEYDLALINGDYDLALEIAEERLAKDPSNNDYRFDKAYALDMMGRENAALHHYEQIIKRDPTNAAALNNIGLIFDNLGDKEKARNYLNLALDNDPDSISTRINYAIFLYRSGDMKRYLDVVEEILEMEGLGIEDQLHLDDFMESTDINSLEEIIEIKRLEKAKEDKEKTLKKEKTDEIADLKLAGGDPALAHHL